MVKNIFLGIAVLLCVASFYTYFSRVDHKTEQPVLVWTAGIVQDRIEQVEAFHKWMRANNYLAPNGELLFTVKLETANNQSVLIQAVSGMAGDLIDHVAVNRFAPMGILEDITDFAQTEGMDPAHNYPAAAELLFYEGRQYAYPCNLSAAALLVNEDVFKKFGMAPPPSTWTPEEFERIGLEFIKRANEGLPRQHYFFAAAIPEILLPLARSMGRDQFNETLTACTLNAPEFIRAIKIYDRWVSELHIIPSEAEASTDQADASSVNSQKTPQFMSGRYAMLMTGRFVNMDLRRFRGEPVHLAFAQSPQYDYKNQLLGSRNTAIYKGSKHKELAKIFLKFLASQDYNNIIITDSDGLPPNPHWAKDNPAYHTPKGREFEGNLHANELKWALEIGIPVSNSPYYPLGGLAQVYKAYQQVANRLKTPEEALALATTGVDFMIQSQVEGTPTLQAKFKEDCELQKKIDEYKAAGKKLPAAWIKNSFYRKYYRDKGMLAD